LESGRVNQKRRTRGAIVAAAQELLAQGVTPTVAQAAEAAEVSRTTAYRYFPTQESLLLEITVHADVDELEELVAQPVDADHAAAHTVEVLDQLNRHVLDAEVTYRTALRLYLDLSLDAAARGEDEPVVREGRRRRWIAQALAPMRSTTSDDEWERVVAALCMLMGTEAMVVLRDVCRLDAATARDVARWTAETVVHATFGDDRRARARRGKQT
jgi:AcrR family transcriptional regulator